MIFWITIIIIMCIAVQSRTWANKVIVKKLFLKPERLISSPTMFMIGDEIQRVCIFSVRSGSLSV